MYNQVPTDCETHEPTIALKALSGAVVSVSTQLESAAAAAPPPPAPAAAGDSQERSGSIEYPSNTRILLGAADPRHPPDELVTADTKAPVREHVGGAGECNVETVMAVMDDVVSNEDSVALKFLERCVGDDSAGASGAFQAAEHVAEEEDGAWAAVARGPWL